MKVELLSYTANPERTIVTAAKQCYSGVNAEEISDKMTDESVGKFVQKLANTGHTPVEHANFTFVIEGISRACSHQLVRHRLASYSQQSQRYVTEDNFLQKYIIPPSICDVITVDNIYDEVMEHINNAYKELVAHGVPKEDARYVLPNAAATRIIVTMNARSLMHFFNLRCCTRAQWEIRELANEMLRVVKEVAPNLFAKAGPHCVQYGVCIEEYSCGRIKNIER